MIGVLFNTCTVLIGSVIGLLCHKGISQRLNKAVMTAVGLCTVGIGICNLIEGDNLIVMVVSISTGMIIGTLLNIDKMLNTLGEKITSKLASSGKGASAAEGFVTACLLFCVGAMTITGSIQSGISGDNSIIFTKSILDLISATVLAASLGIGVLFSSAFVLVFQGGLVLLAGYIEPFIDKCVPCIACVGGIIIIGLGLNLIGVTKIKVADMLPAILLTPFVYYAVDAIEALL